MSAIPDRGARYRRRLLVLLSSATFFEGYDNFVLAFVLALVLGDLGGSEADAGWIRAITSLGAVAAFALAAQADRIGRRRLLLITIVGYTIAAALTALSPGLLWLTGAQFAAQVFLGAEWAVAITIVVEEFPRTHRGKALGIVTSMNTLGGIFVGVLAFVGLQDTPLGWRGFFVVGLLPLILIAWGRRSMLETERYEAVRSDERSAHLDHASLFEPWRPAFRTVVVAVGLVTFFRYFVVSAGAFWWAYYAQQEVGMSVSTSGLFLAVAGLVGALGFLVAGRMMDRFGRKPMFEIYLAGALVFGTLTFQVHTPRVMLPILCTGIFFGLGSVAMTSAFATEPFPTYVRSRAAAWCRNAFEIPGGVLGALTVGLLGDHVTGPVGSIGDAMALVTVAMLPAAMVVCWFFVPETNAEDMVAMDEAIVAT
ncbi:MAG TPA: MFS transporter [Actinomycetota bacterium]|nr:MFS transporter [Actinomycetota bacterium]